MDSSTLRRSRPELLRRRSSVELHVKVQEGYPTYRRGKHIFLSVNRTSTFALITSIICAYAWFFSIGIGTSCMTLSLFESAQQSLLSLQRDIQEFQNSIDEIKSKTELARQDLQLLQMTCRPEPTPIDNLFSTNECWIYQTMLMRRTELEEGSHSLGKFCASKYVSIL